MKPSLAVSTLASVSVVLGAMNPIIQARQARIRRDLVDVCASVNDDLVVLNNIVVGRVRVCLCVSAIPDFIKASIIAQAAVTIAGEDAVTAALVALINGSPNRDTCSYPAHTVAVCKAANPCFYQCTDGFEATGLPNFPTGCVCRAPKRVCNGSCGNFSNGCVSAAPIARRNGAYPACGKGKEICGVSGGGNGIRLECINTKINKESCGGCVVDSPFGFGGRRGKDCTSIPFAVDTKCDNGHCVVEKCGGSRRPSKPLDGCVLDAVRNNENGIVNGHGGNAV